MAKYSRWVTCILIKLIQLYQLMMCSLLMHRCRFEPTCSVYAIQALQKYHSIKGGYLLIQRLIRCHPWNAGGFDPLL